MSTWNSSPIHIVFYKNTPMEIIEKIVETYFDWVTFGDPLVQTYVVLDSLRQYWEDTSSSVETLTEKYWSNLISSSLSKYSHLYSNVSGISD